MVMKEIEGKKAWTEAVCLQEGMDLIKTNDNIKRSDDNDSEKPAV